MRRRGGRGIVGTMATTAVVAGTAGAVHHRQEQRYQNNAMQQQSQDYAVQTAYANQSQLEDMQAQMQALQAQQASAAAGAAAAPGSDIMVQLQQLANMQASGLLTPEQYEAAKTKLLGL